MDCIGNQMLCATSHITSPTKDRPDKTSAGDWKIRQKLAKKQVYFNSQPAERLLI